MYSTHLFSGKVLSMFVSVSFMCFTELTLAKNLYTQESILDISCLFKTASLKEDGPPGKEDSQPVNVWQKPNQLGKGTSTLFPTAASGLIVSHC